MNRPAPALLLDLVAPLCALLAWSSLLFRLPRWPFAVLLFGVLALALGLWRVLRGGRVRPAAIGAAFAVVAMMFAYGVLGFVLLMMAGAVATMWLQKKIRKQA